MVLVSRLHMLPPEKVDREMEYLRIVIEKTGAAPASGKLGSGWSNRWPVPVIGAMSGARAPFRCRHVRHHVQDVRVISFRIYSPNVD